MSSLPSEGGNGRSRSERTNTCHELTQSSHLHLYGSLLQQPPWRPVTHTSSWWKTTTIKRQCHAFSADVLKWREFSLFRATYRATFSRWWKTIPIFSLSRAFWV